MVNKHTAGVFAAFSSAIFLGMAPVFGKLAITQGFSPFAVVALRTGFAAGILLIVMLLFYRQYLYIFPVGLIGCILAGTINGFGSLFYYMALQRLDASLGQLLYSLYPFFVALWLVLDHQPPSRLTIFRITLATIAVLLLTYVPNRPMDTVGVVMMIMAAILYAMHLPINQRVLYEVPAPTVALYTLLSMSAVVIPAYFIFDNSWPAAQAPWLPVAGLTFVTIFSRVALFLGVKKIGGMQTALLGLAELLIAILFSSLLLGESLSITQWLGALGLGVSLILVMYEKPTPFTSSRRTGWLSWIRPPGLPKDTFGPYE
ncbi:MAG: DMT family transporter [Anaerolineales bacterium]|uniref:DMT family transporter n=1 Tax=Candidatus Villigracilis vicinus TaxID=3140679 RepID=UPI003136E1FD|nr:DMT family transporter [Anaerolineales bacterium]MBK7449917.1 DMT family transporter [Anaerolineales bacterium]MBK9781378.1 DMT family transporter [Anaerolineales bacterium]